MNTKANLLWYLQLPDTKTVKEKEKRKEVGAEGFKAQFKI